MTPHPDETHRVLAQADSLMRRHRVFVAGSTATTPPDEPPEAQDDDVPVLTEIVASTMGEPAQAEVPAPIPIQEILAAQQQHIEQHIAQTVEQWLDEKLPEEVLRVMDGLSDHLIGTLVTRMRAELIPQLLQLDFPIERGGFTAATPEDKD